MPAIIRIGDPVDCGDFMGQGSENVLANNIPVSRQDVDHTIGHCYAPAHVFAASPNVFTNNHAQDRVGDPIFEPEHVCPDKGSHPGNMAAGSPNVFVNDPGDAATITLDDYTAEFLVSANSVFKQPAVSAYIAAIHDTDDEGAPSDTGGQAPVSTDRVPHSNKQSYVAGAAQQEGVDLKTPQTTIATATPQPTTPAPINGNYNYADIDAATNFPGDFPVSPNFSLASLTTACVVSHYPLQQQTTNGRVYTTQDIVKNLRDLCYNILEPLKQMYPSMHVNSAFRHTSNGRSQHERGQAADMAMSSTNSDSGAAWPVAQAIANSSLPYDQFIYEQNNTIWFHVSFDRARGTQRRMLMSKSRSQPNPVAGLHQVQ